MAPFRWSAVLATIFVCGCASHQSGTVGAMRWYAQLKPQNLATTGVLSTTMSSGATAASFGSLTVVPAGGQYSDGRGRLRFEISISAPSASGNNLAWAVFSGPCNSPTPAIAPLTDFPILEVASSGAARVRVELATAMDPRGSYHVNVYEGSRATDVSNVLMCANLRFDGRL